MIKGEVRRGEYKDIPSIVEMANEFWTHTIYNEPYDPETVKSLAASCIDNDLMAVYEVDRRVVGFACGVKGALIGNGRVTNGVELAWWLDPEHRNGGAGISLLKFLENIARLAGIKYWNMVYMESCMPEHVKSLYEKMGYRRTEVTYTKVL